MRILLVPAAALILSACSDAHSTGVVARKISATEAEVSLESEAVQVGTSVEILRNQCYRGRTCRLSRISIGTVTEFLNPHNWVAKFADGSAIHEGDVARVAGQ
jgi:hypothetical protein